MEFNKALVYTAANADELKAGDKVIVADDLTTLKCCVKANDGVDTLYKVEDESSQYRFGVISGGCEVAFNLAYLVERKENCSNCGKACDAIDGSVPIKINRCDNWGPETKQEKLTDEELKKLINTAIVDDRFEVIARAKEHIIKATNIEQSPDEMKVLDDFLFRCWQIGWLNRYECSEPKAKQEAEKRYRPFRGTGELIQAWLDKGGKWQKRELTMPLIWVQRKNKHKSIDLITGFGTLAVSIGIEGNGMKDLFNKYEFLDETPCGVEVKE